MSYIDPARKLLWHADTIAHLQRGETPPAPINVEIDLTNRCSLGCEWCHFAYTHTRGPLAGKRVKPAGAVAGGDVMSTALAHDIVLQLHEAGVRSVTWTGGGEPTLHPDFDEIVARCPLPQGLYTHGGHISRERAALLKARMEWVYVSLDEIEIDTYRARKGGDVTRAIDGIGDLCAAAGDAVIGVGFLLHADNWRDAPYMAESMYDLGADYVQFRPVVTYDMAQPSKKKQGEPWVRRAAREVDRLAYQYPGFVLRTKDRFMMYYGWTFHPYDTCHWANLQVAITPNGKVWDCVNKREFAGAELGDLSREPWADVWARRGRVGVDESCRVMCRGHVANVALEDILTRPVHAEFV